MRIFISYPREIESTAERLALALRQQRHKAFYAATAIRSARPYDEDIRKAIQGSQLFIFLITSESVSRGHYCLSELNIARDKWEQPDDHILPVEIQSTPIDSIPSYLRAVSILKPVGDPIADITAWVSSHEEKSRFRSLRARLASGATVAAAAILIALYLVQPHLVKVSGEGIVIHRGQFPCCFVVRAVNLWGWPVKGVKVAWSQPDRDPSYQYVGETDSAGLTSATNMFSDQPPGTYREIAVIARSNVPSGFTRADVAAQWRRSAVQFLFKQR